ncbi:hypothetical protein [Crystallibacter degradans]|uniref:hypothetical protein n=1 Tax=Crystallibacter degradans TaxID=2726743 RepID=UPI001475D494|nr:hypothetical protein [Arthrobacter sp. SF27]NMR29383.1 hypothetical protein [Arthrobacter sp. SF27]
MRDELQLVVHFLQLVLGDRLPCTVGDGGGVGDLRELARGGELVGFTEGLLVEPDEAEDAEGRVGPMMSCSMPVVNGVQR